MRSPRQPAESKSQRDGSSCLYLSGLRQLRNSVNEPASDPIQLRVRTAGSQRKSMGVLRRSLLVLRPTEIECGESGMVIRSWSTLESDG